MPLADNDEAFPFRILTLDGGGSKGVYSLGVLSRLESHLGGGPLCNSFDLIYGTSTGAIIGALIGLGCSVDRIADLYDDLIPRVMASRNAHERTSKLKARAQIVFGAKTFKDFRTRMSIVTTNYSFNKPTIFKSDISQTYSMRASFEPGFGCLISEAVIASCAAVPFFKDQIIETQNHGRLHLIDGGFVANNPTLLALTDAISSLGIPPHRIRLLSVGVGKYKQADFKLPVLKRIQLHFLRNNFPLDILDTTLSSNANTTEILVRLLFPTLRYARVNEPLTESGFETHLLEYDTGKLSILRSHGINSFGANQSDIDRLFSD